MTLLRVRSRALRISVAVALVLCLAGGVFTVVRGTQGADRTTVVAYFDNSNGIFVGDDVMILGVPVGTIDKIEPEPRRVKITFSFDDTNKVPADVKAVIIAPTLVTARAIQLTPAYTGGSTLADGAVIDQNRTAVPVEYDDLRKQLEKLTQTLQPTEPGGVSTLGAFITTAADNLRGQGANIREAIIELSQAFSTLGDHSSDIFGSVKSLSALVTALQSSTGLMRQLNGNLATVTGLLANDPNEVDNAVRDLNTAVGDVQSFVADNREALGTTSDRLASVTKTLGESLDDIKQTLHIAPTAIQNFVNIYEPSNGALTGVLAVNNFSDPISLICGAIQAASRLGAEQSAKLCVQYLAPIIKNRQFNYPPLGEDFFVGPQARPNEVTFSEDRLRPQSEAGRVMAPVDPPPPPADSPAPAGQPPLAAETTSAPDAPPLPAPALATDPNAGLTGLMVPPGGGS
jgi:phospholipid/cholesterol/gamma-HCH transport system substrate-binding protein